MGFIAIVALAVGIISYENGYRAEKDRLYARCHYYYKYFVLKRK